MRAIETEIGQVFVILRSGNTYMRVESENGGFHGVLLKIGANNIDKDRKIGKKYTGLNGSLEVRLELVEVATPVYVEYEDIKRGEYFSPVGLPIICVKLWNEWWMTLEDYSYTEYDTDVTVRVGDGYIYSHKVIACNKLERINFVITKEEK